MKHEDTDIIRPLTRQHLQEVADDEGIEINWSKWNEIVEQTKQQIQRIPATKTGKPTSPKYVYDFNGNLISEHKTTKECADALGVAPEVVTAYARTERPHYRLGVIITNYPKDASNTKVKYVYQLQWKLIGTYTTREAEKIFNVGSGVITTYAREDKPYLKKGLWFRNNPIQ
jgi:hypothetical protein